MKRDAPLKASMVSSETDCMPTSDLQESSPAAGISLSHWQCPGRKEKEAKEKLEEDAGRLHLTALHNQSMFPKGQWLQNSAQGYLWRLSHSLKPLQTFCPCLFLRGHLPQLFLL